ncbi:conserved hypothetical protein [Formosa agariphila KMM 3901]|uniref:Peptidase M56 domain-containing protein n=1 Tax=Formosa agariphila (strain DSM 15362 / KCTC 12365 / LMG 23005 / KMM 3901 / M-2Alg 35-1) TaxID=1347342 RepID=T2KP58_FORAG|nr:hypothetical protein [Formosa agariphila]CDF80535.1 conserved hypothetical protein [Formosa agariphila KMM 3901]
MILISKYITPKGYQGITLYPFVFLRDSKLKRNVVLINHERIHLKQQLELLILPFYIWYGIEFLFRLYQFKNWNSAYNNISFEREAYTNEKDLNYLKSRPLFSFKRFL